MGWYDSRTKRYSTLCSCEDIMSIALSSRSVRITESYSRCAQDCVQRICLTVKVVQSISAIKLDVLTIEIQFMIYIQPSN